MNPTPPSTPSTVALRTLLQDCEIELQRLDLRMSRGAPVGTLELLNVRLALIYELLQAQRDGVLLATPEQQLFDLLLAARIDRLIEWKAGLEARTAELEAKLKAGPPLEPPPTELPLPPGG